GFRHSDRTGQQDRAARSGSRAADAFSAAEAVGDVRDQGAGEFRAKQSRVDDYRERQNVGDSGEPASGLRDFAIPRRSGGEYAAAVELRGSRSVGAGTAGADDFEVGAGG